MRQEVLYLKNMSKIQKAGIRLQNINLRLYKGELAALLGPNGVGKTSLLRIISGMVPFDEGELYLNGQKIKDRIPERIPENIMYIPGDGGYISTLSDTENVFLGSSRGFLLHKRQERAVFHLMEREHDIKVSLRRSEKEDIGAKKLIRLFAILRKKPQICLIDEPLAYLNPQQKDTLYDILTQALQMGISILVSTHDLSFAADYAAKSYILHESRIIRCVNNEDEDLREVYYKMMDTLVGQLESRETYYSGEESLIVKEMAGDLLPNRVSFSLYRGECAGIVGTEYMQRRQFMEMLAGMSPRIQGEIFCRGVLLKKQTQKEAMKRGIVYLPNQEDLIIDRMRVSEYVVLNSMKKVSYLGCVSEKLTDYLSKHYINRILGEEYDHEVEFLHTPMEELSFGARKIVRLAQILCQEPQILLIDSPTLGLDMKIKQNVQKIFLELQAEGRTILINSTEDDELALCDRFIRIQ